MKDGAVGSVATRWSLSTDFDCMRKCVGSLARSFHGMCLPASVAIENAQLVHGDPHAHAEALYILEPGSGARGEPFAPGWLTDREKPRGSSWHGSSSAAGVSWASWSSKTTSTCAAVCVRSSRK